jgi:putative ABC transport system substrate-binding protein
VFGVAGDPVKLGLAESFNRPGGNATGMSILTTSLEPKRLGLLHELAPRAATVGFLFNANFPLAQSQRNDAEKAARDLGLDVAVLAAGTDDKPSMSKLSRRFSSARRHFSTPARIASSRWSRSGTYRQCINSASIQSPAG